MNKAELVQAMADDAGLSKLSLIHISGPTRP